MPDFIMGIEDAIYEIGNIKVLFIAGFGPIVREATPSRKLYNQILGIGFTEENGGYLDTEALPDARTSRYGRFRKQRSPALVKRSQPAYLFANRAKVMSAAKSAEDNGSLSKLPACIFKHSPRRFAVAYSGSELMA
jgi:hypothetical protein